MRLYHNPRCSKSRQALALLEVGGVQFETVLYLDEPLSRDELEAVLSKLDGDHSRLVRTGDALFKELDIDKAALEDAGFVADLLAEHPLLMERPLLVSESAAVIGRPPKSVLSLLKVRR